jgi:mono/diheme cytochrome c family protein
MPSRAVTLLVCLLLASACTPAGEEKADPEASSVLAEPAIPQDAGGGDPYRGYAYARQVCATCHSVAPYDPQSPAPAAPTFADILDRMDAADLRVWLQSSHPTMPDYIISEESIDDIIAYMMGLKAGGPPP